MISKGNFAKVIFAIFLFFIQFSAHSQILPSGFSYSEITGFTTPVGSAFNANGTKMFVWEKAGKVFVFNWNSSTQVYDKQATPVIDISPEVGDWRDHGLLGFALDPNFDVNGFIYLLYAVDRHYLLYFGTPFYNPSANSYLSATIGRVTRYKTAVSGGHLVAIPGTRTILLGESKTTGIPILYESHGIGALAFASDGTLLVSAGDGASYDLIDSGSNFFSYYAQALADGIIRPNENVGCFRSQMLNSMDGKILRIDPATGNGISSNPYYDAGAPRSAKSRVWALGFRNPFRFAIRPNTGSTNPAAGDIGEIYVCDVGWNHVEEITIIKEPGENAGWPFYEGLDNEPSYAPLNEVFNKDEPNPLYGTGGCTQQYFTFRNLLKQANGDQNMAVYNPCDTTIQLTTGTNLNRFYHRVPAIDWIHYTDSSRVAVYQGSGVYDIRQIGTPGSGVEGNPFSGDCSSGGVWYTGTSFPPEYQNTFFNLDYGASWIKNMTIQFTDKVQKVSEFGYYFGSVVDIQQNPLDGSLYCTDVVNNKIYRIQYSGALPPVIKMTADKKYGPGPLSVSFTGDGSFDPQGGPLSYSWDFGDGSPADTAANPTHVFTSGDLLPRKFVIKLEIKNNFDVTVTDSVFVSLNNTPPNVTIISPINNSTYRLGYDTSYTLQAIVSDNEHSSDELFYTWQTVLRHNFHQHVEPYDTNKSTSAVISRIGCNGDTYYWFTKLTVTDAAGLSSTDSSKIFPQCSGTLPLKLVSFTVAGHGNTNLLNWNTAEEFNLRKFEVQRCYDGVNFESIGSVNAKPGSPANYYEFSDDRFLDGYVYYRLKMIDNDGYFSYSLIVKLFTGTKANVELTISPNPFKDDFLFGASFKNNSKATFRVLDAKGAVVKSFKKQVDQGFNSFMIHNLAGLHNGIYFLEVVDGTNVRKAKMIKQN